MHRSPESRVLNILGARSDVYILNQSASNNGADTKCLGADSRSRGWNALYEAGIALINSAGNDKWDDPTDCTIGSPGSAIGVMPVGGVRVVGGPTPIEELLPGQSRGGTATEGGGRTILGLSSISRHVLKPHDTPQAFGDYFTNVFGATSGAAPTVAGAAALFREWYVDVHGNAIDDPGILYANLLLQADGLSDLDEGVESYDLDGFNNLYGAGRLRLRTFDAAGLDYPHGWETGSFCVPANTTASFELNDGDPLSADVEYIKGVAWWYDHDHDDSPGNGHDTYSMFIQRGVQSSPVGPTSWSTESSDTSGDSRKRVFVTGSPLPSATKWRIRISAGSGVTSDNEGCGMNANRVYYAVVWEDNDRDDGGDLGTYIRPEPGSF